MSVGKKKRFEVFKRDKFTCQYCGQKPPSVVLECDHIKPRCEGGDDDYTNLITSCFECNRGKAGNPLDSSDPDSVQQMQLEQIAQLTAFNELLRESMETRKTQSEWLAEQVAEVLGWQSLSESESASLKVLARKLDMEKIVEAAEVTASKRISGNSSRWRYFCGVCWRMVKGD